MRRIRLAPLIAAGFGVVLAGCVVVSENRGRGAAPDKRHPVQPARLEIGTAYNSVLDRFGPPAGSSARVIRGVECRYLRYPLQRGRHGGDAASGTVQLVFRDGRLIGWGSPQPACPGPDPAS